MKLQLGICVIPRSQGDKAFVAVVVDVVSDVFLPVDRVRYALWSVMSVQLTGLDIDVSLYYCDNLQEAWGCVP